MGKQGFLGDIYRSLDKMEQEVYSLCGLLRKGSCGCEQHECCDDNYENESFNYDSCEEPEWYPPKDYRPPCGREKCCCFRRRK